MTRLQADQLDLLQAILKIAKAHDLSRLKLGDIEIELRASPQAAVAPLEVELKSDMPTDTEMLFYSTDTFEDITSGER